MKMKTRLLVLAVLAMVATSAVADPDPDFYVFLCFGQSNMEGFPGIEGQDKTAVDDRFQVLAAVDFQNMGRTKGNWYNAVPPLCRGNTGLCPADYFGRTLLANLPEKIRVGIVNISVAGCKIELFEKDTYQTYASKAPPWMANIITQYNGNPYQYLVDMARLAQKDGVIKGILLHQGESNTNDKEWPGKVKGIYDNLIKDLNLTAEEVPLLAGELVNANQGGACASMNAIIDELPQIIPASHVISSSGCACRPDHLHFTPAGYRLLGTRYAQTMLPLLGYKSAGLIDLTVQTDQIAAQTQQIPFKPTLESLEQVNPVPEWFKDAKFGIYFHWGVYTVPAFANEWYPRNMYIKGSPENKHHMETYGDVSQWPYNLFITGDKDKQGKFVQFAPKRKSEGGQFDPDEWAQLFADAGAKFAGPVAEHHDGFSMWASSVNPWNAKDTGPKLDLVGLLTEAIREKNMRVILSMHHAYNITGYYDAVPKTNDPKLRMLYGQQGKEKNEAFWLKKHKEIIDNYQPDIIWQDFNLHVISKPVLLEFLSYYYNKAAEWDKQVVATYKDGLNTRCAVLDYERGGPIDITENYWLTDDAISSSSWCYTEGIGYYSKKQILHGFFDRISKNGNLLLNISPKADGSIPQEQKDVLLAMGAWLKKYGEAVYATRAWEKYGEGPTRMGAAHGVFMAPSEGTAKDVRYTRSKENTTLYAILLGWEQGQNEIILKSLSSDRIDIKNLKSVELINGEAGKYLPLTFKQDAEGLIVHLPERAFEEMAYVLRLRFDGKIPSLDMYADLDCTPYYYIVPGDYKGSMVLGSDLTLTGKRKDMANQWKMESAGKGIYKILNRESGEKVFECSVSGHDLALSNITGKDNQFWKIENARNGLFKISNKQFPTFSLSAKTPFTEGNKAGLLIAEKGSSFGWQLLEVCEMQQEAFKPNTIPGTIEAEDFDIGCPGDAFYDKDEINEGGQYRLDEGVDIEKCTAGGYNVGWTRTGEWMSYTVTISKSATYQISFYYASAYDSGKLHLECDGADKTGIIQVPNTAGFQNWDVLKKTVKLDVGQYILKLVVDGDYFNLDKMVFEEMN
jgi:alpha-L-fucosidase